MTDNSNTMTANLLLLAQEQTEELDKQRERLQEMGRLEDEYVSSLITHMLSHIELYHRIATRLTEEQAQTMDHINRMIVKYTPKD